MENNKKLGDKIFDLRNKKNMSQYEFAKKVKVARQTVSKWEANIIQPKPDKLESICQVLGVDLKQLISYKNEVALSDSDPIEPSEAASDIECNQGEVAIEQYNKFPNKKMRKAIIAITVLLTLILLVGIILLIMSNNMAAPNQAGDFDNGVKSTTWNFSMENLGWIFFGLAITIGISIGIIGTVLIYRNKNKKNYNKENYYGKE